MTSNKKWHNVVRLDRRYTGHRQFKFLIEFMGSNYGYRNNDRLRNFLKVREWCHDMWGHTCERDFYIQLKEEISRSEIHYEINPHWSWHSSPAESTYKIYFKDQEELNMFTMRWSE
jgi:hypothetical protein